MNKKLILLLTFILIFSSFLMLSTAKENFVQYTKEFEVTASGSAVSIIQIGNVLTQVKNDGLFPAGEYLLYNTVFPAIEDYTSSFYSTEVVYTQGIVWGGFVNDGQTPSLRVNGSTYTTGLKPGRIIGIRTGVTEDPFSEDVNIWRVRPDWETADLSAEAYFLGNTTEEVRSEYQDAWQNWPAEKGAPFQDLNDDGMYNPTIDIPGVPMADQTLWYVANDIGAMPVYGSAAIGIEMQMTLWAYDRSKGDPFNDMIFKRVRLIYKGTASTSVDASIDSMYLSQWTDPDVGFYGDDYVGCDSVLQLALAYNSTLTDEQFDPYGMSPPAIGFQILEGPAIPSMGDTAIIDFKKVFDMKNISANSFYCFASGSSIPDPTMYDYDGTLEFYNLIRGYLPVPYYPSASPWIDPLTGQATKFPLSGDPVTQQGWIDGIQLPSGDRRMGISTGPFQMTLGDTIELVTTFIGETGWSGKKAHLQSLNGVKLKASMIKDFLKKGFAAGITTTYRQVRIGAILNLHASILSIGDPVAILEYKWRIIEGPATSEAKNDTSETDEFNFTPDIEGDYTIQLKTINNNGTKSVCLMRIQAYDNSAPEASLFLDKTEITWGDSILADASNSYDPDGDPLFYNWNVSSSPSRSTDIIEHENTATLIPINAGLFDVTLITLDDFSSDTSYATFKVNPLMENVSIRNTLMDSSWFRAMPYFFNDKILIPMYQKDFMRIYQINESSIDKLKDVTLENANRIRLIKDNYIYVGLNDETVGFYGPGPISIFSFDNEWNLTPILDNYGPEGNPITGFYVSDDRILLTSTYMGLDIYNVNFFSDPAHPLILNKNHFETAVYVKAVNDKHIFIQDYIERDSLFVIDRNTLTKVKSVDWEKRFYSTSIDDYSRYTIRDSYLLAGTADSLTVYFINADLSINLMTRIAVTPVSDISFRYFDSGIHVYSGQFLTDDLLEVIRYGGTTLFDVSDMKNPVQIAHFYDGNYYGIMQHNGRYYSSNIDMGFMDQIVEFDLEDYMSINQDINSEMPKSFNLNQNYPNPFNPITRISYQLPNAVHVNLSIFSMLGQKVGTLVNKKQVAGYYNIKYDASKLASGVYVYQLKAGNYISNKKMLLIK